MSGACASGAKHVSRLDAQGPLASLFAATEGVARMQAQQQATEIKEEKCQKQQSYIQ